MEKLRKTALLGTSVLTAGIPFFCCWAPAVVIGVAGFMGLSTGLEWLHPARPYLHGISILSLGFVHYRTYRNNEVMDSGKAKNANECGCGQNPQSSTISRWILWITTSLVVLMMIVNYLLE